jgi:hypothetical protein
MERIKADVATTLLIDLRSVLLQRFGNSVAIQHRIEYKQKLVSGCPPETRLHEGDV